ncbi:MAG: dephospho-CoA kinase [Verrucomicrobiales bacterium]|nr:dephospho-CoA kinase [Verrucomicrobiales bacterium]|tara:strand:- start:585 stop:1172 length:588 start_codon:yes stop_codon:yes gene_type:complete
MIKISLVGDIGSGKTYISRLFRAPCFSADIEVKKLYKNDRKCFRKLKKKFPSFIKTFPIKKFEMSNVIKNKNSDLKKIGQIVHPFIRKKLNVFLKRNKKEEIVVLDIPLYLENKMYSKNDIIIFLKTKKKDVDKRLKKRKNFNQKILYILRKSQLSLKQKLNKSDYVLVNDYNSVIMKKKIKLLKKEILNDRSST